MTPDDIKDDGYIHCWATDINDVSVKEIGIAHESIEKGSILASFNAG